MITEAVLDAVRDYVARPRRVMVTNNIIEDDENDAVGGRRRKAGATVRMLKTIDENIETQQDAGKKHTDEDFDHLGRYKEGLSTGQMVDTGDMKSDDGMDSLKNNSCEKIVGKKLNQGVDVDIDSEVEKWRKKSDDGKVVKEDVRSELKMKMSLGVEEDEEPKNHSDAAAADAAADDDDVDEAQRPVSSSHGETVAEVDLGYREVTGSQASHDIAPVQVNTASVPAGQAVHVGGLRRRGRSAAAGERAPAEAKHHKFMTPLKHH